MLCDSHIHFIPEKLSAYTAFYKGVWADKQALYAYLDKHKIDKALLGYPSTDAHLKLEAFSRVCDIYNQALEEVSKENPKIITAGIVDLDSLSTIVVQVKELKQRGFGAISIASSFQGKFLVKELEPLFEAASVEHLPIFIHPQTINPIGFERVKDPLLMPVLEYSFDSSMFIGLLMMEGILEKYAVKFIVSSLGGVLPFLKDRFDRVYQMLRSRGIVKDLGNLPSEILKNVYVDTSGASLKNIQLALELFGEDKLLWGSDYPVCGDIQNSLKMLDELGQEVKEKITHKNFQAIFPYPLHP
ncbi:MAG: amidohydrolase [Candidatus Omnitrophica bacterium]|nr:amidohydrolase [Candidatus Omnitrophota bacterium]MBU2266457.1 amidohydrolase [Candidatus Omnitrophota bacterium]MBU2473127.1 amidohydrolase [Candidatus Omnitrophota bacterium]